MIYLRIIVFLILLLSVVFLSPFFVLGLFVLAASFIPKFWEGVLVGIALDSLYFSPVIFSKFSLGFFTVNFIVLVFSLNLLKDFIQGRNLLANFVVVTSGFLYVYFLFFLFA